MALGAWHEHSSACRGRSAGRHLRPVLVGSFYPLPRTSLATASNEGRQEGRPHVPAAGCALHDPSPACAGRWAGGHRRSGQRLPSIMEDPPFEVTS